MPDAVIRPSRAGTRPLVELAGAAPGIRFADLPPGGLRVAGVTHDSRAVRPGDLFVGMAGRHTHGAAHVEQAVGAGAVAVLTDPAGRDRVGPAGVPVAVVDDPRRVLGAVARWAFGAPADRLTVLGVTGTNGKTTTTHLAAAALRGGGRRTGLLGTVGTAVGDQTLPSVRTTPEATDLHALFAVMVERGVESVCMEVSSHALALGRVDGVRFAAAVFTNLSQDHLDFHGDMNAYFAAKAELFTPGRARLAVLNVDDPRGKQLARTVRVPVRSYSPIGDPADWRAEQVSVSRQGTTFLARGPGGVSVDVSLRLLGRLNVANALAALAAATEVGVPAHRAAAALAGCTGVPGRLQRVDVGQPFLALVDYAHTPAAVAGLLRDVRQFTPGRVIVVLGCGGDRDRGKRPLMGAAAVRGADLAVFTSDNPRSEDPAAILRQMTAGLPGHRDRWRSEPDRVAAIRSAVRTAQPGDTLVVAGKGHEQGQELADRVVPFDDAEVLQAALTAVHA